MDASGDLPIQTIEVNGFDMAYVTTGDGPLALCLHGFPDTAHTWRHLMPVLADAGYRVVAPWMRGYAPTAVPSDGAYQTGALAADALALHEMLGGDAEAVIIGHDWGAFATYGAAAGAPDRWSKVVTMSVPPAAALMAGMLTPAQLKRSWYIWFFQMAGLPEMTVPANGFELIARLWDDWSPGYRADSDIAAVASSLDDPANLAAAVGYYRAMFDPSTHLDTYATLQAATQAPTPQPTLYLHGANDGCLGAELVTDAVDASLPAEGSKVTVIGDAGHFLHLEQPGVVANHITTFLTG